MLFNSVEFLIFFPVVVLIYFLISHKLKYLWLLFASYFFYMCWNAKYAILLVTCTVVTWIGGLIIEKVRNSGLGTGKKVFLKKSAFIAAILINLSILFYYKYINFCLSLVRRIAGVFKVTLNLPVFDIILPVGISFYIFQALGYLIDVYRGDIDAEKNLFRYALFVSFFPQLVAGPIERSKNLLSQLNNPPRKFDEEKARDGLLTMLWGFFLKIVIADRCAVLVDTVYGNYVNYSGFQLILANVLFAVQIYCDFMGYSTIAKGAAKVLGINLMDNFRQPYFATSVKEFWRRWHISLSTWFRDYIYIPLGGNRCSKLKYYRNLLITFTISGLWHGAGLSFVLWGILHGIYQIIEDLFSPVLNKFVEKFKIDTSTFSWKFLGMVKTFILTDIAWVFFRADSIKSRLHILITSFNLSNLGLILNDGIYKLGLNTLNINILAIALIILVVVSAMKETGINPGEWIKKQNFVFRYALYWGAMIMIIFSLSITGKEFVYFQF